MGRLRVRRPSGPVWDLLLRLSNRHVHAQLVDRNRGRVIVAAHTTEPLLRNRLAPSHASYATASVAAARVVGIELARRAAVAGVREVYWRPPARYHGKVKAFADAVREGGLATLTAPRPDIPFVPPIVKPVA